MVRSSTSRKLNGIRRAKTREDPSGNNWSACWQVRSSGTASATRRCCVLLSSRRWMQRRPAEGTTAGHQCLSPPAGLRHQSRHDCSSHGGGRKCKRDRPVQPEHKSELRIHLNSGNSTCSLHPGLASADYLPTPENGPAIVLDQPARMAGGSKTTGGTTTGPFSGVGR